MSKSIAVAMIVKNEEALLARCLESVKEADAIYILDTGSQDRTIEIALQYTPNVFIDYVWTDNFAEAQNVIKERVKEDWILSVDADEYLNCPFQEVRDAIEHGQDMIRVKMIAEGKDKNDFYFGRLFRNSPDIFWMASIHKHLNIPGIGEEIGNISIVYGWSPAHLKDPDRSLRMLEKAVADGEGLPRNMYYLGREYAYKQRYQDCIDTLEKYVPMSHWDAELAEAYLIMAQCYKELGNAEQCAIHAFKAIIINSNFKEAIEFMASIVMKENQLQWKRMARTANNEGVLWKRTEVERNTNVIVISPHNDDEALFVAYTLLREKPLVVVVTDSYIQPNRGDQGCDSETRRQETINAMEIADCPVMFLGIKDTELTESNLRKRLQFLNPEKVYAPAIQGGNIHHDIIGRVAKEIFGDRCEHYCTYTKTELYTTGTREIKPTQEEMELKRRMLLCYQSQLALGSTKPHFDAVMDKSEWML